jgi:hypothetical protein
MQEIGINAEAEAARKAASTPDDGQEATIYTKNPKAAADATEIRACIKTIGIVILP